MNVMTDVEKAVRSKVNFQHLTLERLEYYSGAVVLRLFTQYDGASQDNRWRLRKGKVNVLLPLKATTPLFSGTYNQTLHALENNFFATLEA